MSENVSNESIKELLEEIRDNIQAHDAEIIRGLNYLTDYIENTNSTVHIIDSTCERIYSKINLL